MVLTQKSLSFFNINSDKKLNLEKYNKRLIMDNNNDTIIYPTSVGPH